MNLHDIPLGDMKPTLGWLLDNCKAVSRWFFFFTCMAIAVPCEMASFLPKVILAQQGIDISFNPYTLEKEFNRDINRKIKRLLRKKNRHVKKMAKKLFDKLSKNNQKTTELDAYELFNQKIANTKSNQDTALESQGPDEFDRFDEYSGDSIRDPNLTKEQLDQELDMICAKRGELTSRLSSQSLTDASLSIPTPGIILGATPTHSPKISPRSEK